MITQTYTISTIKQSTPPIVKMSQYDHGSRTITFSVVDGSGQAVVLTGKTVRVEGTRLDGHAFAEDCTVSGSTASFTDTSDMTNAPGAHPAELVIESDGDRLGTMNFVISVETAAMDENADITEEDVSLFEQLLGSIEDATGAVEAEKTAALSAIDDDKDAALLAIAQGLASGSPLVVEAVADMTDQTAVYLYSGSESGYTAGNFYFWNGSAWVSGGTYGNPTVDAAFSDSSVNPVQNKVVSAAVSELKSDLSDSIDSIVNYNSILSPYLYKENMYINNYGVETIVNGYNTYKIPVVPNDIVYISQTGGNTQFWNTLSNDVVFKIEFEDETYDSISGSNVANGYRIASAGDSYAIAHIPANARYFIVTAYADYVQFVNVAINMPFKGLNADAISKYQSVLQINESNSFVGTGYKRGSVFAFLSGDYIAYTIKVKTNDKLVFSERLPNLSYYAAFTTSDGVVTNVNVTPFIVPSDGMINIFGNINYDPVCTYYPANSIELDYSKIKNPPVIPTPGGDTNYYDGLSGVAFGTSLTYRAQTTGGYLQYLPDLSGITFDNQGVGSATILDNGTQPNMLVTITNYAGWSGKRVCLLEGFVNDWYYNGALLGTWKDTGTATVCGCVRSAITHILTQNANLTLFLILDHFGKGITAANALNSANQTQLEFYQEIEKVALSMGVRVIREYEISEISQLTPQFLLDNIHLNSLGSEQSAKAIWSGMKATYPNVISS